MEKIIKCTRSDDWFNNWINREQGEGRIELQQ